MVGYVVVERSEVPGEACRGKRLCARDRRLWDGWVCLLRVFRNVCFKMVFRFLILQKRSSVFRRLRGERGVR